MRHVVVIGGGIVGLAVARELTGRGDRVTVLEKEDHWAAHQTGHNSNVVHAGLYYKPGSLKARMSVAGNASMVAFAREHGVPVECCGKLVVATTEDEMPARWTRWPSGPRPTACRPSRITPDAGRASTSRRWPVWPRCGWSPPASSTSRRCAPRWSGCSASQAPTCG